MPSKIVADLKKMNITNIIENEPLYKHTTYRVGGPAQIYVEAASFSDLTNAVDYAHENNIKYFVLGNGSNILVSDKIFEGIVISTKKLNSFEISGNEVYAMCGVNLITLAFQVASHGLSGLEFASGIPGLIGGSVYMNAGAYKRSFSDIIKRILVYRNGRQEWLDVEDAKYSYRHSVFQEHTDWVILAVDLTLEFDEKEDILELMETRKLRRQKTQPFDAFSAGSVFKNPSDTVFSWQLIDKVEMRGYSINDAQVSIKHSNFIINLDRASGQDIYDLIKLVQKRVSEETGTKLKIEQELVNFDEKQ